MIVKNYPKKEELSFQWAKQLEWRITKNNIVGNVSLILMNRNIKKIGKYLDKISIFQLDYLMLITRSENFFAINNTKYITTQNLNIKIQELKGGIRTNFYQIVSDYYGEMN